MDIQRVLILVGLAVTSYMLILAWNEDYGQGKPQSVETVQGQQPVTDNLFSDIGDFIAGGAEEGAAEGSADEVGDDVPDPGLWSGQNFFCSEPAIGEPGFAGGQYPWFYSSCR